jgi:restriction system protein
LYLITPYCITNVISFCFGEVTQASNDGGIDGIIKEDLLGLGRVHIQAKRYNIGNTIGRDEIQKFVGALAVAKSNKGIFITTSARFATMIDICQVKYLNNIIE